MKVAEKSPLRKPLQAIMKSGMKAAAIVNDLPTLARRGVSVSEVININNVVNKCMESPEIDKIRIYHPGVIFKVRLEEDLWNSLGSPFHPMKALTNLISNAAEAMPNGGKITVRTENLKINDVVQIYETVEQGEYVVLTVSDEGYGMPIEDKRKIFEPFYTKKAMGKSGTGLGMTVVWNTVKDHKGHINVESIEGIGTTFSLYFPMRNKPLAHLKSQLPVTDSSGKGESILVVDDVEEKREIAFSILSELGYSVATVSSGKEAIGYVRDHSPDLVILDMIMSPGIDGLDTYKGILKLNPQQKAVIMSGYAETDSIRKARRLGAGAYIKKPFLIEEVGIAVRNVLERSLIGHNNN